MKICLKGVEKKFGSVTALEDVSFTVKEGEFVFLTGPSGSGKTTVFRILTAETFPDTGMVQVGDWVVFDQGKKISGRETINLRRKVGVVYQTLELIEEYTVEENILLALDILGMRGRERQREIERVLEKVALRERKDAFPRQLSGGELQRLCLARALVMRPAVLLADEPTGNLDPQTSWQLIHLLDKINKEGTTVVMATHNFDIVNSLRRRVIKLIDGRIIADKKKGKY